MKKLVVATHNEGKLAEFRDLLAPHFKSIVSSGKLGLLEPEETGKTFAENAMLKAQLASEATGCAALADDSGLCVTALGGRPGIHSARWAEIAPGQRDFKKAMQYIEGELDGHTDRSAAFVCALAITYPGGRTETFEGRVDGTIIWPPRGKGGHGYDPFFVPKGEKRTFAEMSDFEKNAVSHRANAVKKLILWLGNNG